MLALSCYENPNCNAIVVVFIMVIAALASMISFGTLIQNQTAAAQQFSMSHRILADNSEGNTMGWNPNGNRISFTIFDDQFNSETSTVIVNTFQSNFVVCNVDYMYNGAFEVNCNNAPANAGQLHYTIINLPASGEGAQSTISQQVANQIARRENAANQTQLR